MENLCLSDIGKNYNMYMLLLFVQYLLSIPEMEGKKYYQMTLTIAFLKNLQIMWDASPIHIDRPFPRNNQLHIMKKTWYKLMLILEYIEQVEINNISKSELPTILHNMKENNTIKKKSTPYRYKITKNGPLRSCSCWYCIELDAFRQLFIMVTHLREKQKKKKGKRNSIQHLFSY